MAKTGELVIPKERQLTLPGFKCTENALIPNKTLTEDQWAGALDVLGHIEGRFSWYVGDAINAKRDKWEYGTLESICEEHGLAYGTANNCLTVSRAFDFTRRRVNLTWGHHAEVANRDDADELLDWCEENDASIKSLREKKREIDAEAELAEVEASGRYRVIYADPPWKYGDERGTVAAGGASAQYPLMSIDSLCGMDVSSLAAKNAVLFMWVTAPLADEALDVVEAWGFEYKTHIIWDKKQPYYGNYSHVQHELLYICTRGSCTPAKGAELPRSVISIKKTKHSAKPHEFYEMIETLYPRGKRIELFARNERDGWDSFGNEVNGLAEAT